MPIIETKGSMSSQGYGQFARSGAAANPFIEDVFSTTLYTGTGAAQSIPNGIRLAAGATSAGWIGTLGGSGNEAGYSVAVDSSGNVYVCGFSSASGTNDFIIAKYNTSGAIQWQRSLGGSGNEVGYSVAVDSSGNVYVCGFSSASGTNDFIIAKYNTSGAIQWQRSLGGSGSEIGYSVAVDSSGNVYVCGDSNASGTFDLIIAKYNTSGAIQWQRSLGGSGNENGRSITVDSSGNVYVCGNSDTSGTNDFIIAKYNTSGAIQWQRSLGGSGSDIGRSIAVDSSGNVYVCGNSDTSGTNDFIIAKYNTSGAIQWQRSLGGSGIEAGYSVAVDSSGNVYVCGFSSASGTNDFIIAKYNTSGAIQWQRSLGGSGNEFGFSVAVDSSGNVYVFGYSDTSGTNDFIIAKLPGDGSGTGAYNVGGATLTYAPSTLTDAASTLTDAASTLTSSTSTLTDAASTLTDAAATLNSSVTPLAQGAGLGGLVWIKFRNSADWGHVLTDTNRGASSQLISNSSAAQTTEANRITSFNATGFSIGGSGFVNQNNGLYVSWTFAQQPKFFDVVTYTGDGSNSRGIAHNLNTTPGAIIIKSSSNGSTEWLFWHRSLTAGNVVHLNLTFSQGSALPSLGSPYVAPTDATFTVGNSGTTNLNGATYVAYLFAHNAGGFGASGTDNVISCGSYTGNGSATGPVVTLGYEPQWLLIKRASGGTGDWNLIDNMRGFVADGTDAELNPNLANAESTGTFVSPTATGFQLNTTDSGYNANGDTFIYIAIRRGPMRTPTSGTSVFRPVTRTGSGGTTQNVPSGGSGFVNDLYIAAQRSGSNGNRYFISRLADQFSLDSTTTAAEQFGPSNPIATLSGFQDTVRIGAAGNINSSSAPYVDYFFRRAPGFFDVVCYTGTGVARTVSHNLGVAPELMIVKCRNETTIWFVAQTVDSFATLGELNLNNTNNAGSPANFNNTLPTSSVFSIGAGSQINRSGGTFVAYLFASLPGISKVGSYTGTGSTVQVNCGFTAGARFVLIKRTDAAGDWYVWDSARGIVAGNDPYLLLNSAAAEVTSTDWVDTLATGFEVSNAGSNLVNVNGGTYIFLAIA